MTKVKVGVVSTIVDKMILHINVQLYINVKIVAHYSASPHLRPDHDAGCRGGCCCHVAVSDPGSCDADLRCGVITPSVCALLRLYLYLCCKIISLFFMYSIACKVLSALKPIKMKTIETI